MLLVVTSIFLIRENFRLRAEISEYQAAQYTPVGVSLPPIHGLGLDGREVKVPFAGTEETLLFFFSPQCAYCKQSWSAWTELARVSPDRHVVFVNVGGAVTSKFLATYPVGHWELIAKAAADSVLAYRIRETPVTLLLNPKGVSEQVWEGAISESMLETIKKVLARH